MSEIIEKIKAELEAFNQKKVAFVAELKKEFPAMFTPIFAKSKKIKSFGWSQYTPYFNDGEECTFGVNNSDISINGVDQYECEFLDWRMKYVLSGDRDKKKYIDELSSNDKLDYQEYAIVQEIESVLESIPEDFYRDLFGDHVQVTVNADGTIETEEYEHD